MPCETTKIVSADPAEQGDFVIINLEDFDESIHVLYVEPAEEKAAKK